MDEEEKVVGDEEVLDPTTEEVSEDTENNEVPETGEDVETVPLKTFLDLKSKYKNLKKDHHQLREKSLDDDSKKFLTTKKDEYIALGYDENLAEKLAEDLNSLRMEFKSSKKDDLEDSILEDINDLKGNKVFQGIEDYTQQIVEKIKETKRKGFDLDVEDAFILVSKGKHKINLKDKLDNDTQAAIIKNKQGTRSNVSTSTSSPIKNKFNLDADDVKALKELQKAQPNAKWTTEKYHKLMKEQ